MHITALQGVQFKSQADNPSIHCCSSHSCTVHEHSLLHSSILAGAHQQGGRPQRLPRCCCKLLQLLQHHACRKGACQPLLLQAAHPQDFCCRTAGKHLLQLRNPADMLTCAGQHANSVTQVPCSALRDRRLSNCSYNRPHNSSHLTARRYVMLPPLLFANCCIP